MNVQNMKLLVVYWQSLIFSSITISTWAPPIEHFESLEMEQQMQKDAGLLLSTLVIFFEQYGTVLLQMYNWWMCRARTFE